MQKSNELRQKILEGMLREEVIPFLRSPRMWSFERGDRVIAEVGNDDQVYCYTTQIRRKDVKVQVRGWRDVFLTTGLGKAKRGDLEVYFVLMDGGRGETGNPEGCRVAAAVYNGDKNLTQGEAIVLEDDTVMEFDGERRPEIEEKIRKRKRLREEERTWVKRKDVTVKSALDKMIPFLDGLEVKEDVQTRISHGIQFKREERGAFS